MVARPDSETQTDSSFRITIDEEEDLYRREDFLGNDENEGVPKTPKGVSIGIDSDDKLEERRQYEKALILKYDSRDIKRHECWFLIDAEWIDSWMRFITKKGPLPGALDYSPLYDSATSLKVKKGLKAPEDYRGVTPMTYAIYYELYGCKEALPIPRWAMDIYASPVAADDLGVILRGPRLKARVLVTDMRYSIEGWPEPRKDNSSVLYKLCCECSALIPIIDRFFGGPTYADKSMTKKQRKKKRNKKDTSTYTLLSQEDSDEDSDEEVEHRRSLLS